MRPSIAGLAALALSVASPVAGLPTAASADAPVKVGVVLTLSGPSAALGQQVLDGFTLALRDLGETMGGRKVEAIVADDALKPDVAVSKVREMVERDRVDFVVGPVFSNVLQAIHRPVTESGAILVSPNAGTSIFAGKGCHPGFFVTSYQNDQVFGVLGKVAGARGYRRVFVLVPNYQAGRDAVAGFRRHFDGEVVGESYAALNTVDFQADLARIATAAPDAVFTFMPGGMGVALVRQYRQAGLADRIPFLSAFTVDESTLPAQQDAALGMLGAMTWAPDAADPRSRKFVSDFEAAYGYVPGSYAMQAYDAAMLIAGAVEAVGGDTSRRDAMREAMRDGRFRSLRGDFRFNANGFPIQDFYLVRAAKRPDGKFQTEIVEKVFEDDADPYAADCAAKG
jgi:branched-chain amino acid transport system substrate-binding protein